jgi:hypothetical protein
MGLSDYPWACKMWGLNDLIGNDGPAHDERVYGGLEPVQLGGVQAFPRFLQILVAQCHNR